MVNRAFVKFLSLKQDGSTINRLWRLGRSLAFRILKLVLKYLAERCAFGRLLGRRLILPFACVLLFSANSVCAIEIEEIRWGYDGQIVSNHFNLLSILVSNPTPNEIEGTLKLGKLAGGFRPVDAIVEKQFFMSPYASKWIQLYPYCIWDAEEWTLSWGPDEKQETALPKARAGNMATIILEEPDNSQTGTGRLKRFPDNLFPATVTATESLDTVFLDHAPRWGESRRKAFLGWLRQGGKVRLLHQANGKFPKFPSNLSLLNSPSERTRVGSGLVVRHYVSRSDVDLDFLKTIETEDKERQKSQTPKQTSVLDYSSDLLPIGSDSQLFNTLRSMTRVKRNWFLIYGMAIVYLLLIFPGCYLVALRKDDYRLVLGMLIATVAVFSTGFLFVGRRDYAETTTIRSVAIANHIGEAEFRVSQWSEAAVTRGNVYEFTHGGSGRLYSTCEEFEAVKGTITNGVVGRLLVDIPPFSSRTFSHRAKIKGQSLEVSVVDAFIEAGALHGLDLQVRKDFPEAAERILCLYRDRFYEMKFESGRITMTKKVGLVSGMFLHGDWDDIPVGFDPTYDRYQTLKKGFRQLHQALIARSLGLNSRQEIHSYLLPDDLVRLYVYAPMPESLFVVSDQFENQSGFVLYIVDLPLQGFR